MPTIVRGAIEATTDGGSLRLTVSEHHEGPRHFDMQDLVALGLKIELGLASLPESRIAKPEPPHAPAPTISGRSPERGMAFGGFEVEVVRTGLDVWVVDYHSAPIVISTSELKRLGLIILSSNY